MSLALRPALFWDTDTSSIDLHEHRAFIIERIVLRGRFEEFKQVIAFYGREEVKQVLLNSRWLDKKTLAFCASTFHVAESEFRCYKLAQSNQEHWTY